MPGMNGTGPQGIGPRTGWRRGRCISTKDEPQPGTEDNKAESMKTPSATEERPFVCRGGRGQRARRGFGRGRCWGQ